MHGPVIGGAMKYERGKRAGLRGERSMAKAAIDKSVDTFPKFLLVNAATRGSRPAIREKDLGIWQTWNWAQVKDEVKALALGLKELGIEPGDKVAIVGSNKPRLYWSMAATQSIGGIPVPVYQDAVADEMSYVLSHAGAKIAIVENQEQVDKVLSISDQLPSITHVIYDEPRGLRDYDHTRLKWLNEVQEIGRKAMPAKYPGDAWEKIIAAGKGSDIAVILYTSGTTGKPKGVMLTYDSVVVSSQNANAFDNLTEKEEVIAYLPMAWVGDHIFSYAQSYVAGYTVNCPESPETIIEDRREIGTSYAFAPPRVYENLLTLTMVRMEDAGRVKRAMFHYFLKHARTWGEKILNKEPVPFGARLKYWLGELLVYGPMKNRYGFTNIRVAYTAGEAIGPEIFRYYRSIGINLKQLYGQTEAAVYITAQPDGEIYADTVGKPSPDVEIKIEPNGEVLFRSPGVFAGYYKDPEKTAETKTPDGWVKSGDAGFFDPKTGHLKIIDRAKDVGKLNDGTLFAPKYIENKLKFYPNIKEAVALGDKRDYVTVMLNIDLVSVGSWAERNNVIYGSYQELAAHPRVYQMLSKHVDEVNKTLSEEGPMAGAQIKRFLILHKELDADDGELTRTQKVRRGFITERYGPLASGLYDGAKEVGITTELTFEDGRKGNISARVKIEDMKRHAPAVPMDKAA